MPSSVLLIDDHPLLRRGLQQLIDDHPDLDVVGEASSGAEGVEQALSVEPDLILLDLNMKGMDGLDTLRMMRAKGVTARVVILTVSDLRDDVAKLFRAGADGYLLKDMEPEDLLERIAQAAGGCLVVDDRLAGVLAAVLRPDGGDTDPLESLTSRETDILYLIADGLSNKLIAKQLDISEGTVKVHVKHLLRKLGVRSRVEAAVWVVNHHKRQPVTES